MRLAVIGPQNTGKTTFINDFLKNFPEYHSPKETYRDVIKRENLQINQQTNENSQKLIRDFLYNQIKNTDHKNLILDRCLIDNLIYTKASKEIQSIEDSFVKETEEMMRESLNYLDALVFIPTSAGVKIADDDLRDTNLDYIDLINREFISTLFDIRKTSDIKIFTITGGRERRVSLIKSLLF